MAKDDDGSHRSGGKMMTLLMAVVKWGTMMRTQCGGDSCFVCCVGAWELIPILMAGRRRDNPLFMIVFGCYEGIGKLLTKGRAVWMGSCHNIVAGG